MSFILYVVVLVVSISSVMMGLDWLSTPPPPVPKSVQTVSAPAKPVIAKKTAAAKNDSKPTESKQVASAPTVGTSGAAVAAKADTTKPTAAAQDNAQTTDAAQLPDAAASPRETAGSAPVNAASDALANAADSKTNAMADAGDVSGATADAAAPSCDVQACGARYHSFNPADCTYQPFEGPRRLCTVGNPPHQADAVPASVQTSDARQPQAPASCNVQACGAAYRSFDAATCSYQPLEGPRRLCAK